MDLANHTSDTIGFFASDKDKDVIDCSVCLLPIEERLDEIGGADWVHLKCNCCVHRACLIEYVKAWSANVEFIQEWGIKCPNDDGCEWKRKQHRIAYIELGDLDALALHSENENMAHCANVLQPEHVDNFKRFSQSKRCQLSCGCHVPFNIFTRHIKAALELQLPNEVLHNMLTPIGVECPMKSTGQCLSQSCEGIFISTVDVRRVVEYGRRLIKGALLPPFTEGSEPAVLDEGDAKAFGARFDWQVLLGCGCWIHAAILTQHLRQSLAVPLPVPAQIAPATFDIATAVPEETIASVTGPMHCFCPRGQLCCFESGRDVLRKYKLTKDDLGNLVSRVAEKMVDHHSHLSPATVTWVGIQGIGEVQEAQDMQSAQGLQAVEGFHFLTNEEVRALGELLPPSEREAATRSFIEATSAPCPGPWCAQRHTHWHGHGCHHARDGCDECGVQFCYRCRCTGAQNTEVRGSESMCECGGWSNFCTNDELEENIVTDPFPRDRRCGCPICPECRPNRPCPGCDGDCAVCLALVLPGPSDLDLPTPYTPMPTKVLCRMGVDLELGRGVPPDLSEAVHFYRLAALRGHALAQYNLARCYSNGLGVRRDHKEAAIWFERAAEQGDVDAQVRIALCYLQWRGVKQDLARAAHWFLLAARQGHSFAQFRMGVCFATGAGVQRDPAEAVHWYRLAAEGGCVEAAAKLGWCFAVGSGVQVDSLQAAHWNKIAGMQPP